MSEFLQNKQQVYEQLASEESPTFAQGKESLYQSAINEMVTEEEEVLRQSLMVSVSKNPDQMAQMQKLSEQSGMPLDLVQRNVAVLVNQQRVQELKDAAKYSPILAKQLSDPKFAMLAYDDYEPLSTLESVVTKGRDYAGSVAKAPINFIGTAVRGTGELYGVGVRSLETLLDQVLPNSAMSMLRTPIPEYLDPGLNLISGGKALTNIGNQLGAPPERQGLDTDVVEGISQLSTQIAIFLLNPAVGTGMIYASGAGIMAEKVEKDDALQSQKDAAIVAGAAITGLTERYGLGAILNRLPPKVRNRTLRFIADKVMAGGIEAGQEIIEGLLHDLTRRVFTNENAPILEGALREASAAAISAAIVRAALGVRRFRNDQQQQQFFEALGDSAKASKLRERMPERFQQLVENLTKAGPVKEVFIPADQFQRFYQSQNIDPAAKAEEFGVTNYTEALAAGTDLVLPMDRFVSRLAPSDDLQGLSQDIRLSQNDLTAREYAEYEADQEARLQEILDDARRSVGEIQTPELLLIKDEMLQQLLATGYTQTTADAYATVYAKTMNNLAERAGVSAKTLHDKYSLSVTRPLPDVLTRDRRADAQLDPLLDRLRSGNLPTDQEIYGKSLTDFLIEQGGLKAYGELVDVDVGRGPFQKNLVQPETGLDADRAAELAVEAGYLQGRGFEDVTERDLFDAIDEDLFGERQYSIAANQQLLDLRNQLNALDQALRELGIDVEQIVDNAEVRRLLEQATQAPEIRDAIAPLFQAQPTAREPGSNLLAIHNLTEDNIRFANKMGGLASPSVGVVTDMAGMVEEFGEITLIGTKDLADPSVDPVFAADAYTVRYPDPEWSKPKRADSDALYDIAAQAEKIIDTGITQQTDSLTTRVPDAGRLISTWLYSDAIRALYLQQELGQQIEIVRDPVRSQINLTPEQLEALRPLYDVVTEQERQGIRDSAELNQLRTQLADMMRTFYESKGIRSQTIDSIVERYTTNPTFTLGREYDKIRRGPQINLSETGQKIQQQIDPVFEDFRKWVESTVLERFDDPYLTIGRKKVPYTLENIVKVVTSKKEQRAVEKTMGYGDAKAKAAAALKFSDIEQMREAAKKMIVQPWDFAAARQESQEIMRNYREMMIQYPHQYPDLETRRDDAMRAIAKISTVKNKTPAVMRSALAQNGFTNVDQIADADIESAIAAAEQLIRLPVPYFEAKPQRIVRFNEFAGAVVPLDASQDVIDILEQNGMRVEYYEGFDRQEVVQRLANQLAVDQQNILFQEERGFIQFGPERKFNITLLEKADLTTFLHETGHFYLEVMGDLAQGAEANPQIQDDYATILNYLGLKSRDELTLDGKEVGSDAYKKAVDAHEKFARSIERYFADGKAPSAELRSIFQRFKTWFKQVYKDLLRLDVELTDEVRGVFDRMFATDQEIQAAQAEGSFDALFVDAAAAGMTEAEFAAYRETVAQASESAKESLLAKLLKEKQRETQAWWKEELDKVKQDVAKEFDELPAYKALIALTDGDIKLNKKELVDLYGEDYLKRLPRRTKRVYTRGEGLPLEAAARELGYPSGDSLIEALIGLPNRKEYIQAEAERIMRERHGDMMTDGSMADEALIELHNEQREKVLAAELRALRRKQREVAPFVRAERQAQQAERRAEREAQQAERRAQREAERAKRAAEGKAIIPPMRAFRDAAKGMIGQTAVRDIVPQRFLLAGRKAGLEAKKALKDGDTQAAAAAKQKELLNHFLYKEAVKARENSDKIAEYARKFEKKSTRERIGKAGGTYLEQIDAILDGYEFRRVPNRKIDRRASLQAFVDSIKAKESEIPSEEPVNIPESVLRDARQINYRQLSYDELLAVNEAVRNIEHLANLKNRLTKIAEKRELDIVARDALESLAENSKGAMAKKLESALPSERPGRFLKGFMLLHTKFSTMMRQMDGWKDDGTFWNLFVRPLNEAADFEAVKRAEATKALRDIFKQYRDVSLFSKKHIKSIGQSMTLQGRLMVALNWGRAENRQRLMDGNGLSTAQIDEILGTLDERDWKVVQEIWSLIDSYWPSIETQYKALYGTAPQKSDTLVINTKYGPVQGGYFPIKYDPTKTAQAQAQTADEILNQMKSGAYMRSQTKNGFTKEVLEKLDRPIKLDLSSLYEHLGEVVHDLALREYLLDTNKLMNHRVDGTTLKQAIIDTYGDQFYGEIRDTLRDVAIGDIGARGAFEQAMSHLRAGVSIAGMGWNLMTGLMQPLGLTQSFVRIGPKWVSKGIMKWGMDAVGLQNSAKWIYERSDFMRTRNMTQNREINEIRNQIKRQGKFPIAREAWGVIEDSYFQLIIQGQKLVDIPTWLGAYEKAISEGKDEGKAVALADQAVMDSQGGGSVKDLAAIQRGGPLLKLWTNFYSYFNTTFNLTREVIGRTKFNDPISIGRAAVDLVMLYSVPVILGEALRMAVKVFITGEDDDEEFINKLQTAHLSYLLGTMVGLREFSTAFDPRFGYSGPAGVRFIADFSRFAKQVSQGELDEALRKTAVTTVGTLLHYPAGQINRIIDGISALQDGRTESPAALIFGVPK